MVGEFDSHQALQINKPDPGCLRDYPLIFFDLVISTCKVEDTSFSNSTFYLLRTFLFFELRFFFSESLKLKFSTLHLKVYIDEVVSMMTGWCWILQAGSNDSWLSMAES